MGIDDKFNCFNYNSSMKVNSMENDSLAETIFMEGFTEGLFEAHVCKAYQALMERVPHHNYAVYLISRTYGRTASEIEEILNERLNEI